MKLTEVTKNIPTKTYLTKTVPINFNKKKVNCKNYPFMINLD